MILVDLDGDKEVLILKRDPQNGALSEARPWAVGSGILDTPRFSPDGDKAIYHVDMDPKTTGGFGTCDFDVARGLIVLQINPLKGAHATQWPDRKNHHPSWGATNNELLMGLGLGNDYRLVRIKRDRSGSFDTDKAEILWQKGDSVQGMPVDAELLWENFSVLPDGRILAPITTPGRLQVAILSRDPTTEKIVRVDHVLNTTDAKGVSLGSLWPFIPRLKPNSLEIISARENSKITTLHWPAIDASQTPHSADKPFDLSQAVKSSLETIEGKRIVSGEDIPGHSGKKWINPQAYPLGIDLLLVFDDNKNYLLTLDKESQRWRNAVESNRSTALQNAPAATTPDGNHILLQCKTGSFQSMISIRSVDWKSGPSVQVWNNQVPIPGIPARAHLIGMPSPNHDGSQLLATIKLDADPAELVLMDEVSPTRAAQKATPIFIQGDPIPGHPDFTVDLDHPFKPRLSPDGKSILLVAEGKPQAVTGTKVLVLVTQDEQGKWLQSEIQGPANAINWNEVNAVQFGPEGRELWLNSNQTSKGTEVLSWPTHTPALPVHNPPATAKPFDLNHALALPLVTIEGKIIAAGEYIPGLKGEKWVNPRGYPVSLGKELLVIDGNRFYLLPHDEDTGKWGDAIELSWLHDKFEHANFSVVITPDGRNFIGWRDWEAEGHLFILMPITDWRQDHHFHILWNTTNTGSPVAGITPGTHPIAMPSPNHDGSQILFTVKHGSDATQLMLMDINAEHRIEKTRLIIGQGDAVPGNSALIVNLDHAFKPRLSPDGKSILLVARRIKDPSIDINQFPLLEEIAADLDMPFSELLIDSEILEKPISSLEFPNKGPENTLQDMGLKTVGDVLAQTSAQIRRTRHTGKARIAMIKKAISDLILSYPPVVLVLVSQDDEGKWSRSEIQGPVDSFNWTIADAVQFGPDGHELWLNSTQPGVGTRVLKWPKVAEQDEQKPNIDLAAGVQVIAVEAAEKAIDALLSLPVSDLPGGSDFVKQVADMMTAATKAVASQKKKTELVAPAAPQLPAAGVSAAPAIADARSVDWTKAQAEKLQTDKGPLEQGAPVSRTLSIGKTWGSFAGRSIVSSNGKLLFVMPHNFPTSVTQMRKDANGHWTKPVLWIYSGRNDIQINGTKHIMDTEWGVDVAITSDQKYVLVPCVLKNLATDPSGPLQIFAIPLAAGQADLTKVIALFPDPDHLPNGLSPKTPPSIEGIGTFGNEIFVWSATANRESYALHSIQLDSIPGAVKETKLRYEFKGSATRMGSPVVSPDGTQIIFTVTNYNGGQKSSKVMSLDRNPHTGELSNERKLPLPDLGIIQGTPTFSADGYTLYLTVEDAVYELKVSPQSVMAWPGITPVPHVSLPSGPAEAVNTTAGLLAEGEKVPGAGYEWKAPVAAPISGSSNFLVESELNGSPYIVLLVQGSSKHQVFPLDWVYEVAKKTLNIDYIRAFFDFRLSSDGTFFVLSVQDNKNQLNTLIVNRDLVSNEWQTPGTIDVLLHGGATADGKPISSWLAQTDQKKRVVFVPVEMPDGFAGWIFAPRKNRTRNLDGAQVVLENNKPVPGLPGDCIFDSSVGSGPFLLESGQEILLTAKWRGHIYWVLLTHDTKGSWNQAKVLGLFDGPINMSGLTPWDQHINIDSDGNWWFKTKDNAMMVIKKSAAPTPVSTPALGMPAPVLPVAGPSSVASNINSGTVERVQSTGGPLERGTPYPLPQSGIQWRDLTAEPLVGQKGLIVLHHEFNGQFLRLLRRKAGDQYGPPREMNWIRRGAAAVLHTDIQNVKLLSFSLSSDGKSMAVVVLNKAAANMRRVVIFKMDFISEDWLKEGLWKALPINNKIARLIKEVRLVNNNRTTLLRLENGQVFIAQLKSNGGKPSSYQFILKDGEPVPGLPGLVWHNRKRVPDSILSNDGQEILAIAVRTLGDTRTDGPFLISVRQGSSGKWDQNQVLFEMCGPIGTNGAKQNLVWENVEAITHIDEKGDWWLKMRGSAVVVLHRPAGMALTTLAVPLPARSVSTQGQSATSTSVGDMLSEAVSDVKTVATTVLKQIAATLLSTASQVGLLPLAEATLKQLDTVAKETSTPARRQGSRLAVTSA